jgi:hypothetical protein
VPIAFVGSSDVFMNTAGTTVALPSPKTTENGATPATINAGDYMELNLSVNANTAMATPSGWTAAQATIAQTAMSYGVFWRIATGSESWPMNLTMASGRYDGTLIVYSGVDNTTPQDVANGAATATTGIATFPSITPVTSGAWITARRFLLHASGVATGTRTVVNMTQREDVVSTQGAQVNLAIIHADTPWTSGAFTPNITYTAATTQNRAFVRALRPAVGGAVGWPIIVQPPRR